jgi:hypothetical protein
MRIDPTPCAMRTLEFLVPTADNRAGLCTAVPLPRRSRVTVVPRSYVSLWYLTF